MLYKSIAEQFAGVRPTFRVPVNNWIRVLRRREILMVSSPTAVESRGRNLRMKELAARCVIVPVSSMPR